MRFKMDLKRTLALGMILMGACWNLLQAQVYPTVANLVMPFPHSPFLSEYYAPGATKMQVTLQLNDFTVANQRVKLAFEIDNGTINLHTKANYSPAGGILLSPGIPLLLQGSELYDALNSSNLEFSGLTASTFNQNGGQIPEGQYDFCVRVLDFNSGKELSLPACASIFVQYEVPPVLVTPQCGGFIQPSNPQNIRFSWQVAGVGQPSFFGLNTYILHLYQITDPNIADPMNAVLNSKAVKVFESQPTSLNTFNLDFSTVFLVPGQKYVCRLQGIGPEGKNTFQNDGYGEWCWFNYGYPDDGVLELQDPYEGRQFEKTDQRVFVWGGSNLAVQNQSFDYQLTIVEMQDTSQSLADAMTNNPAFHTENLPTTTNLTGANFQLTKELNPDKKYAWQVTASSDGQLVAESEIRSFYSHSLIDHFYASNQKIKVVQTGNADLNNFEGTARIQLSGDETDFVDVPFAGLEIKEVAGQMILNNGQIDFDLSERDPLDIDAQLPENGTGRLDYTTGTIDKTGLKVNGRVVWYLPHAVEPGEANEVVGKESTFVMNGDGELSGESAIEPFSTILLAPKGFGITLKETSKFQLADNELVLQLLGSVDLPEGVTTFNGTPITIDIQDYQATLDYIELPNMLSIVSGGVGPIQGLGLEFIPISNGVIDLSEDKSPGKLNSNKQWKGFYVQDYKVRMNVVNFDPTNQISVPARLDTNLTLDGTSFRFWVGGTGLTLKTTFEFNDKRGLLFNSFQTETFEGEIDIQKSEFKGVEFRGTTKIPFIDDDRDFDFTIPTTETGLETGFIEGLEDLEFIYNPYGGENRMDFTINRAVFVDNTYLQLNCDILCPELDITIEAREDLRVYGDYLVGFGGRNTSVVLDQPIQGRFKELDVTATEIGAAFLGSEYAVSLVMESYLSEGFTDKEGGPPTFTMSSVAATSAEAPAGTPLPQPAVEVPEDLSEETEIKPTGFDINIETPILDAGAYLLFVNNDPTWGTKFAAGVNASLKVPARYNMGGNMTLGFVDGMDYWYFDVYFEDVDGEGVQVMVPVYNIKITNIVGVEGQIYRHVKSFKTDDGDFELELSPNTQFGAKMFMQLIDPYAKGFIYQADLGLQTEIQGPGLKIENVEQVLSGQAAFLNINFRTGTAMNAGAIVEAADALGVADELIDQIFPQSFEMLGKQITLDSKGLSEGSSIEIGSVDGGEGLLMGAKVSSKPGLELGVAYGGYKVYGAGDADGNAKIDLEVAGLDLEAELVEKSKGAFSLSIGDLATTFSGDYAKKKADFSFQLDDLTFNAGGDVPQKSGYFDFAYDGKELGAYASVPGKAGGFKIVYDDKKLKLDVDGMEKSTAFLLEYGDYKFRNALNLTDKSGLLYLETPVGLVDIEGRPDFAKFKAESGEYLFHVQADFPAKTGLLALEFPNHALKGELLSDRGEIFLKKDDFEIGLGAKFDATAGDLHVKEGDFVFDLGADINENEGYLTLEKGDLKFASRYDPADTSFISYADASHLCEARVGMGRFMAQYKDNDHHFLLDLDTTNFSGKTLFAIPDFSVGTEFDASQNYAAGEIEILGHKVNSSIRSDSMAIGYLGGDLDLRVAGKYGGGGSVYFADAGENLATGFSFDIDNQAGSIFFQKDDLSIDIAGNKTAGTGRLGFALGGDSFEAGLEDSLYLATQIDDYGFRAMKSPDKMAASFAYSDNKVSVAKLNDGESLFLQVPSHQFSIARQNNDYNARYQGDDLELTAGLTSNSVSLGMKKDGHEVDGTVNTSKQVNVTYQKSGVTLGVSGDLASSTYGTTVDVDGWAGSVSTELKNKAVTLGVSKSGIGVDATFNVDDKDLEFELGDFEVKGGLVAGVPDLEFGFGAHKLNLDGFLNGELGSVSAPNTPPGIQMSLGNVSIDIGNLSVGASPDLAIDLGGTQFSITPTLGNLCGIDLTRNNNPVAFAGNEFDETINGNRLRVALNPDDSKNIIVEVPDLSVDVTYKCDELPAIKVVKDGKTYAFVVKSDEVLLQFEDKLVSYAAANHELKVEAGSEYTFLVNDNALETGLDGYYLKANDQEFSAGTGQTYLQLNENMVSVHADDKFIEIHSDDTYKMQVDPDKYFTLSKDSLKIKVDSKELAVAQNGVRAADSQENFAVALSNTSLAISKDQYAVAVSPQEVRFDRGDDFVAVGNDVLSAKYQDKELMVSSDKEVSYKDNERELAASENSLYIDYQGKILDVKPDEVRLELASDQQFAVKQNGLYAQYGQYQVSLVDPLNKPAFTYQDNRIELGLSSSQVKLVVDGYGAAVGQDLLHILLDGDYLKYQENDLDFKYGRYVASFEDWESVYLSNGIQEFGISPNELMAALDENNRVKVFPDAQNPGLELIHDDTRFAISNEKAEFDYDGMHYALGKTEYIAVHPLGNPDEGFLFTEDGIRYNFNATDWIMAAPKNDYLRVQMDNKYAAFRDDYSLQFGMDDLTTTLNKDLSIIFQKGSDHSIELNKDDYIAGYTYLPNDVYARIKRFDDNYIGLLAGMDKYAGFVKPAKDKSIEIGGIIEGIGQASVAVNADKDIVGKLKNSESNFVALAVEKAKTLAKVHVKLDGLDLINYGGEVDVFGESLPGVAAVGGDSPSHIAVLSEKAGGWAVGGLKFRRTIGKDLAFVAQGRIQTGLTLPMFCANGAFGAEIRPGKVRLKVGDPSDYIGFRLLCVPGLPPLVNEEGYADLGFEASLEGASFAVAAGYRVRIGVAGGFDVDLGICSLGISAGFEAFLGFGGAASLSIPFEEGGSPELSLGPIFAEVGASAFLEANACGYSFGVSAGVYGRIDLEGDLEGAKGQGTLQGHFKACGLSKSFDYKGEFSL